MLKSALRNSGRKQQQKQANIGIDYPGLTIGNPNPRD